MKSLYEILKSAKLGAGAAPDFHTALMAQKMPFAKGSGAEHEYTGAVPVTFTANGQPLLDYLISGNTVQSGTPTPENPVMPQGTGERTGNLLDKLQIVPVTDKTTIEQVPNGVIVENITAAYGGRITLDVEQNAQYCLTFEKEIISGNYTGYVIVFAGTSQSTQLARAIQTPSGSCTFNTGKNNKVNIWFYVAGNAIGTIKYYNIMLNKGDDYLEYEPYGQYKIPISSASTTTPVYLGEVETTRKIKKLVLDGTESTWRITGTGRLAVEIPVNAIAGQYCFCSHYKGTNVTSLSYLNDKECEVGTLNLSNKQEFVVYDTDYSTAADFKSYLAQQYAAGTPVTVWYVLATPETAVVNEPLMKIGDYADTLSMEQAGVQIPTAKGSTTLDVETTVKPSEVYIKYKE